MNTYKVIFTDGSTTTVRATNTDGARSEARRKCPGVSISDIIYLG